ncbi:MAG TPA: lipoyl synthase [Gemmatimonadota bacterium]|nr:lipoyl synthase [Gemmatimonadota bacterium]
MRELRVLQPGELPMEYEALRQQRQAIQPLLQERVPVNAGPEGRKPRWLKARAPGLGEYVNLKRLMRAKTLHTVCEEAHCPNMGECWGQGTATFMILGDICTRSCAYCAVTTGMPEGLDEAEPMRVAEAVRAMGLKHAVITSVNRDDLADGGAGVFAATIRAIRALVPDCSVEVLTPDFKGDLDAVAAVVEARPEIFSHNLETVSRLYRFIRPGGRYERALDVLAHSKVVDRDVLTKSGVICGMGETQDELIAAMSDLRDVGIEILTLGQYLRPSPRHLPIDRYYTPDDFAALKRIGQEELGFKHVEAGPLVRSSYHAREQVESIGGGSFSQRPAPPA